VKKGSKETVMNVVQISKVCKTITQGFYLPKISKNARLLFKMLLPVNCSTRIDGSPNVISTQKSMFAK
jgi:hypothetical protein